MTAQRRYEFWARLRTDRAGTIDMGQQSGGEVGIVDAPAATAAKARPRCNKEPRENQSAMRTAKTERCECYSATGSSRCGARHPKGLAGRGSVPSDPARYRAAVLHARRSPITAMAAAAGAAARRAGRRRGQHARPGPPRHGHAGPAAGWGAGERDGVGHRDLDAASQGAGPHLIRDPAHAPNPAGEDHDGCSRCGRWCHPGHTAIPD